MLFIGIQGEKGSSGLTGSTGLTGPKGTPGQKGMKGDKEERNGGTVYVRWGHDQCPSTAQLVYAGRAGGPYHAQAGGGSNPVSTTGPQLPYADQRNSTQIIHVWS